MGGGSRFTRHSIAELARQYGSLSEAEKERCRAAGEGATRAHMAGFRSFVKKDKVRSAAPAAKLYSLPDELPAPGDVLDSGAIVAASDAQALELAFQSHGPDLFMQGLQMAPGYTEQLV